MSMDQTRPCHVEIVYKPVSDAELATAQTTLLAVQGMGCLNCAARVHNGLLSDPRVLAASVDLERALATVYTSVTVPEADLTDAVRRAGEASGHHYVAALATELATPPSSVSR